MDFSIFEFKGTRKISELPVLPLDHHKEAGRIRKETIERGRKYARIHAGKPYVAQTSGPAMFDNRKKYRDSYFYKFATHGRAIVDPDAFRTFNPMVRFIPSVYKHLECEQLTDEQLMICSPVALGFSFGDKKWGTYSIGISLS